MIIMMINELSEVEIDFKQYRRKYNAHLVYQMEYSVISSQKHIDYRLVQLTFHELLACDYEL